MQYLRSKTFGIFLVLWTLVLSAATPVLMAANDGSLVRRYSRFWVSGLAFWLWYVVGLRFTIQGSLPEDGRPRLIVSNHQSEWETLLFPLFFKDVSIVAKIELGRLPVVGWYLRKYPMILIDRDKGAASLKRLLRQARAAIHEGRSVLIFPEGTRVAVDDSKEFESGVAALYKALDIPALILAHNSGCYWNDDFLMKYSGTVTVKVIEEIPPGLAHREFMDRVEGAINREKQRLADDADSELWRWALG